MKRLALALLVTTLPSCGADNQPMNERNGGTAVENATLTKLELTSDAFKDGQAIPTQFTCEGADQSPALSWDDGPQGTQSFALIVDDPDAPSGTYRHWAVFDIPANAHGIAQGQGGQFPQAVNDFGKTGYGGPCPPKGHGVHHYHFKLFALDVEKLSLGSNPQVIDVENAAAKHALARGELIGTYERK